MDEILNDFINELQNERNYSKYTITNYKKDIETFIKYQISNKITKYSQIDYKQIRIYLTHLYEENYTNKTICRHISSLRTFFKYLKREEEIKDNPMLLISNPKTEKKLPNFLYYNDLETLLEVPKNTPIGIRDELIMELLYSTGIRVGELVNIKMNDINIKEKSVKVLGKGNKERYVYFGEICQNRLSNYFNNSRDCLLKKKTNEYLLINKNGTKLTDRGVRLIIEKIRKESGIKQKVSPHTFRHTYATHMLNEGAPLRVVQELLGHENISTTGVYTHVSNEHLRNVYLNNHPRARKKD